MEEQGINGDGQDGVNTETIIKRRPRRGFVWLSVYLFERLMPDPFVIAIGLTVLIAALAAMIAPNGSAEVILSSWYAGIFGILGFAFQMILILVTGHALAYAPQVQAGLRRVMGLARTAGQAGMLCFLLAAVASWLNWGFGLVVGALLAREAARQVRADFAWLVAAGYSGWVVAVTGLSSSVALSQASPGNPLNVVQKLTGQVLGLDQTVFAAFNIIPTLALFVVLPFVFLAIRPRDEDVVAFTPGTDAVAPLPSARPTIASRIEQSPLGSILLVIGGVAALGLAWRRNGVSLDINAMIFLLLIVGIALHGRPVAYVAAIQSAASHTGSMMLQYPIYGGIMGIMAATGLTDMISRAFVDLSTAHTLPFWSYIASVLITLPVPSGGGHWAVQGPFVIPAAVALHASLPATTMAVAMGENVSDMLQPFWALPVVAMAGIGIQRVLGFTAVTFVVAFIINAVALLILV